MRHHLNQAAKWKIRFNGNSRSVSAESFLYKLNKIAELEGVPERQLLRDIHLLLKGPTSNWFFTFVDEFELPKLELGNPIRIEESTREFIEFVTEIEKLHRMFSKPLSKTSKF